MTDNESSTPQSSRNHRRSRSPRRDGNEDHSRRKDHGFNWKEKRRDDEDSSKRDRDSGLQRGYRDHYRPRSRSRSRTPPRRRSPRKDGRDRERRRDRDRDEREPREEKKDKRKKKEKKPAAPAVPAQPMITVWVNDRLGARQPIPCLATDPIKDFKVMVAMKIGRKPHEILLKRQGERSFKDQLTLQDYGVSNNV